MSPEELPADWDRHYVPIINRVAAGVGFDTTESESGPPGWANEYVAVDAPPAGAIAVRVVGGSMLPDYASGDILIVDPASTATAGQPAVVIYREHGGPWDTRAVVKVWRPGPKNIRLHSLNPEADDVILPRAAVLHAFAVHAHLPAIAIKLNGVF